MNSNLQQSDNSNDPLLCRVTHGRLEISIGINTLAFAAKRENGGPIQRRIRIVSKKMFAEDVSAEIQREDEIGGTMLSELLDKAMCAARDSGSAGLLWPNPTIQTRRDD